MGSSMPYEAFVEHICNKCNTAFVIRMAAMIDDKQGYDSEWLKKSKFEYIANGHVIVCPKCGSTDYKMS